MLLCLHAVLHHRLWHTLRHADGVDGHGLVHVLAERRPHGARGHHARRGDGALCQLPLPARGGKEEGPAGGEAEAGDQAAQGQGAARAHRGQPQHSPPPTEVAAPAPGLRPEAVRRCDPRRGPAGPGDAERQGEPDLEALHRPRAERQPGHEGPRQERARLLRPRSPDPDPDRGGGRHPALGGAAAGGGQLPGGPLRAAVHRALRDILALLATALGKEAAHPCDRQGPRCLRHAAPARGDEGNRRRVQRGARKAGPVRLGQAGGRPQGQGLGPGGGQRGVLAAPLRRPPDARRTRPEDPCVLPAGRRRGGLRRGHDSGPPRAGGKAKRCASRAQWRSQWE
mmetsp:Transcript_50644/g.151463  ORF Transcript_50644/g.151463 Transcript_50644/m.151463 type:complete len:340 (-) Transcript_50644:54-1073(-)